jgi:hypothetical protein
MASSSALEIEGFGRQQAASGAASTPFLDLGVGAPGGERPTMAMTRPPNCGLVADPTSPITGST